MESDKMGTSGYETVIGLEVHVQLSTHSKAFCGDATAFGAAPNTQVSPISLGHPGTLPRYNQQQINYAIRLGLALQSQLSLYTTFDRKNYFYADLPKGYQVTQDRQPICIGGRLPIRIGDDWREVRIHHVHMEEDAGKSIHTQSPEHSFIDLNRAGVPLLEIVTEPDLRSSEEVDAFMSGIRQLVRYLGISDGNMEEGSMRCDVNVSIRPQGVTTLSERCEIKNINSMRYARQAIAYEVGRQAAIVSQGGRVEQQTLNFDPATGVTAPLRDKEDAHDYRYFPEPDLAPIVLTEADIAHIREAMPITPWEAHRALMTTYELPAYDATLISEDLPTFHFYQRLAKATPHFKAAANLLINRIIPHVQETSSTWMDFPLSVTRLAEFLDLIVGGKVSNSIAYQRLFPALLATPDQSPLEVAKQLNLLQTSDADMLETWIGEIMAQYPDKVEAYRKGKKGLLGFFMGELMKRSKGKADPQVATALFQQALE